MNKNGYTKPAWKQKQDEEMEQLRVYLWKRYKQLILNKI